MKRLLSATLILIILLSITACNTAKPNNKVEQSNENSSSQLPDQNQTSTPTQNKKVTIYLIERAIYFDSGHIEYYYDEDYNINRTVLYNLEKKVTYEKLFDKADQNGMPCRSSTIWANGEKGEKRNLTYTDDGKLKEEILETGDYSGFQYKYNQNGDITEKREYHDAILTNIISYEYNGKKLSRVYGETKDGEPIFNCKIENGLITEKLLNDDENECIYFFKYDQNNNLISSFLQMDGEKFPADSFTYKAIEVDTERAQYILEQQKYLISAFY